MDNPLTIELNVSIEIDNSYRFFDGAISFVAGICSQNLLVDSYQNRAIPYQKEHCLYFEGRKNATNRIYFICPYDIYKYLIINQWPKNLKIYYKEKNFPDQERLDSDIIGFVKVFLYLGQATFIQYWENIKADIVHICGQDQMKWNNIF